MSTSLSFMFLNLVVRQFKAICVADALFLMDQEGTSYSLITTAITGIDNHRKLHLPCLSYLLTIV